MDFCTAIQHCINKGLVFAAYRLPHTDAIRLIVQRNTLVNYVALSPALFKSKGFLIAPFDNGPNRAIMIKPDLVFQSTNYDNFDELLSIESQEKNEEPFDNGIIQKKEFVAQVNQIKVEINKGIFEKVVLSRIKVIERNYKNKLTDIFQLLLSSYPNAFVYMFNTGQQLWIGATPEPLLCSHKNELETVALAGTREYNAENLNIHNWCQKEMIEQGLVARFIEDSFNALNIKYLHKNGPYTKKAGNLIHLRTDFSLDFQEVNGKIDQLIKELHPTSAVCGMPKLATLEYLKSTEQHKRKYYAGYLGPLNIDERLLLFVNLRCMQVFADKLVLYVGAGITAKSDAEEEWNETEIKADTLLSVIHKV